MYVFIDKNGRVVELVNDQAIRKGDHAVDSIYVFIPWFEEEGKGYVDEDTGLYVLRNPVFDSEQYQQKANVSFSRYEIADKSETGLGSEILNITPYVGKIPYDPHRDLRFFKDGQLYQFIKIDLPTGTDSEGNATPIQNVLAEAGLVTLSVTLYPIGNALRVLGAITFNVEDSAVNADEWATLSQYNYLLMLIGKAGIRTVVGTYQGLQDLDISELNDGDVVEVINDSTQGGNLSFYGYSAETGEFTLIGALSQYVTLGTAQTITADKTLTGNLTKSAYLGDVKLVTGSTQKPTIEFTSNQPTAAANVAVETVSPYPADSVRHVQQLQNKDGIIALKSDIDAAIEEIEQKSDVTDIVGTYQELQDYDTGTLANNDIIKVLQDETQGNATTYYKWNSTTQSFALIGSEGPYYTQTQADGRFGQLAAANIWTGQNTYRAVPLVFQNVYGGVEVGRIEESVDDYSLDVTQSHSVGYLELISKGYGVRIQTGSTPTSKWLFNPDGDLLPESTNTGKNIGSSSAPISNLWANGGINLQYSDTNVTSNVWKVDVNNYGAIVFSLNGLARLTFYSGYGIVDSLLPNSVNADLGASGSKWRNLYVNGITGASGTTVPTDAVINKTLGGYDTNSVSIIDYNTQRIMSIAIATTFTLLGGPTGNFHPEYRLKLTNSASVAVAATFTGVSHIITNDSNATVSGNQITIPANATFEISIQDGNMVAINFEAQ